MAFRTGVNFTCILDPPWEYNGTNGLSVELGDLMWCAVSHFWSVCPDFLPVDVEKMGRRGTGCSQPFMVWTHNQGWANKRESQSQAPPPPQSWGQFGAGAYFRYSDTLRRRILSVGYVGCVWWLERVTRLNLEKRILVNKMFSLLAIWASLERLRPDILKA